MTMGISLLAALSFACVQAMPTTDHSNAPPQGTVRPQEQPDPDSTQCPFNDELNPPEVYRTYSSAWGPNVAMKEQHSKSMMDSPSAWNPSGAFNEYVTIDTLVSKTITGIVVLGRGDADQWSTDVSVAYSTNGISFIPVDNGKSFPASTDRDTKKEIVFEGPVEGRFIRIIIKAYHGYPALRAGLLTCGHRCHTIATQADCNGPVCFWADDGCRTDLLDGARGDKGEKGQKGETGEKGQVGDKGPVGDSASSVLQTSLTSLEHQFEGYKILQSQTASTAYQADKTANQADKTASDLESQVFMVESQVASIKQSIQQLTQTVTSLKGSSTSSNAPSNPSNGNLQESCCSRNSMNCPTMELVDPVQQKMGILVGPTCSMTSALYNKHSNTCVCATRKLWQGKYIFDFDAPRAEGTLLCGDVDECFG